MTCQDSRWSFRFPEVEGQDGPFEITPYSLTLNSGRREYDYCRAEFPVEVGEQMKPHTHQYGGELRYNTYVEVRRGDTVVKTLYFKPSFATYGDHGTYLELHDLQESLDTGIVDMQRESIKLRDAYEKIFKRRTNGLIKEIKFTDFDDIEVLGQGTFVPDWGGDRRIKELDPVLDEWFEITHYPFVKAIEADQSKKLVDGFYAIDFENVSPAKALWTLNNKYNIQTWVDNERTLWVGNPEALSQFHVAAPNDDRVWRYNSDEVKIRHPRDPIFAVVVEGNWVDEPGIGTPDDIISWFNTGDEDGFGDVRAEGVAYIPGVDPKFGQSFKIKDSDAKSDALPLVSRQALIEKMKSAHSGQIGINPNKSGEEVSSLTDLEIGDLLQLAPDDKWLDGEITSESGGVDEDLPEEAYDCGDYINNEIYQVNGIQHDVQGENWNMTLDVSIYPDVQVETYVRYFDPRSGEIVTEEDALGSDIDGLPNWLSVEDY